MPHSPTITMNKEDLLAKVQESLGGTATRGAAAIALSATLRAIRAGLLEDGEVKLAGFGTFRMHRVKSRRVLLPGSRRELLLPERRVLRFTASPTTLRMKISMGRTQKQLSSAS